MSFTTVYWLIITIGLVLIGLGWAEKRRKIRINKLGLGFAVWAFVIYCVLQFMLPSVYSFM